MRAALFLDRDGVVNVDHGYVARPRDFEWIDGVFDTVRVATMLGLATIVVTNQAGIARGFYTEADFEDLTRWMTERFAHEGAPLTAVYHCPFHADGIGRWRVADHPDRKPNPGMLLRAAADHGLLLDRSALIGDQDSDIECARRAGVPHFARFVAPGAATPSTAVPLLRGHVEAARWLRSTFGDLNDGGADAPHPPGRAGLIRE